MNERLSYRLCFCLAVCMAVCGSAMAADAKTTADLPLREVVLFSSGVGFFEHQGKVDGNAQVEMKFRTEDINDLLKSLVVLDLDGGRVSSVSYASKDPITKTLKTFAIDLTTKPTLAGLLDQIRGEQVELETSEKISGVILGIELQSRAAGEEAVINVEVLNLLTDEGLRAVPLREVVRLRLVNPKIDSELRKALTLLATSHDNSKKAVTLDLLGEGPRRVLVGYIRETPIWKTTYRLVLDNEKEPLLQGWAIVENTSEQDWQNIKLTLVSGRPISFLMNLYDPLYIPRPEVELELYASLRPQIYGQDMEKKNEAFLAKSEKRQHYASPARASRYGGRGMGGGMGGMGGDMAMSEMPATAADDLDFLGKSVAQLASSIPSAATAGEVGELFQYDIDTPVTLARQKSAMLPIVNAKVQGKKVSIYNASVHAKHPLCGLELTNSTELNLMQGPITVFDDGVYAGDARIEDLPPGAERLISYAMDLDTEVASRPLTSTSAMTSIRIYKGAMIVTNKSTRRSEYTIKNSGSKAKTVLVEQPVDHGWTLVEPKKATEKTSNRYRFAVEAKPGVPAKLVVGEERIHDTSVALTNLNDQNVLVYVRSKVISEPVKKALAEVIKRKTALNQVLQEIRTHEAKIAEIDKEQRRIRDNMGRLDRNSALYQRYVKKFSTQEDSIEKLRDEIDDQKTKANQLKASLDQYLMDLKVE